MSLPHCLIELKRDKHHLMMTLDWRQCCCCLKSPSGTRRLVFNWSFIYVYLREVSSPVQKNAALLWLKEARRYWIFHCSFQKEKFFFLFFFLFTSRFDVNLPFRAAVACLTGSSHTDVKTAQSWVKCAASFLPSFTPSVETWQRGSD